jgi:hypothetical protein
VAPGEDALEGGFGRRYEGAGHVDRRVLDDALGILEVAPREFVGHAEEGLVLSRVRKCVHYARRQGREVAIQVADATLR